MLKQTPYVGFAKDARGVKRLWETFQAGRIDHIDGWPLYERLLLTEWQRCQTLGVDATMLTGHLLNQDEFEQCRQNAHLLAEASIPVMQDVGRFLSEAPALILLTENTGCILHIAGDPKVKELAAIRSGIVEGSQWDEATAGTNGMGTALTKVQPVQVYAGEHFCEGLHSWSCAAAPIFDTDGRTVLGSVDLTTLEANSSGQAIAIAVSLASSIQARLAFSRELERSRLLAVFNDATRQYPHDQLLALDRHDRLVVHTPSETCRRIAERWTSCGLEGMAVAETVEVKMPDTGVRIGKIMLLAKPKGYERVFRSLAGKPRLCETIEPVQRFGQFLTRDPETRRMLNELQRVAAADVNVLIIGETGTGKELLARHLHASSPRSNEPYLAVNCGAISADLMESTFFGYVRGAFSGADPRGRAGYFESAQGGTLFLDELGELPLAMQATLLRVLEDGSFHRVGSCETQRAKCRIIAATHRNLEQLVAQGQFREDLYFRLKIVQKILKPLRERPCDIRLLLDQFLEEMRKKHGLPAAQIAADAREALERYQWPGNAREVRNVIESAVLSSNGLMIDVDCLPPEVLKQPEPSPAQTHDPAVAESLSAVRDYERRLIVGLLQKHRKVNSVAKALGIARSTLYRKFAELEINQSQFTLGAD